MAYINTTAPLFKVSNIISKLNYSNKFIFLTAFNVYPFNVKLNIFRPHNLQFYHCHYNCLSFWSSLAWSVTRASSFSNNAEAYSELCQSYKMERFAEIVNGLHPLTIFFKKVHLTYFIVHTKQGGGFPNWS